MAVAPPHTTLTVHSLTAHDGGMAAAGMGPASTGMWLVGNHLGRDYSGICNSALTAHEAIGRGGPNSAQGSADSGNTAASMAPSAWQLIPWPSMAMARRAPP